MSETAIEQLEEKTSRRARLQLMVQRWRLHLMIGAPIIAIALFAWFALTSGRWQETDNAYVQAARVPISTNIVGRITEMRVHENDHVARGQVLFLLDRSNNQADADALDAALASARSRVLSLQADYRTRVAALRGARQTLGFARSELARARELAAEGIASRQDYDTAVHAAQDAQEGESAAEQGVAAALAALGGSADVSVNDHPLVREAAARLERARLALSYTEVRAPQAGVVTRVDQVQVGSFVSPGQPLFWLLAGEPWIEANFKEDQLAHMRVGQHAEIKLDADPGVTLEARVASFSPGTGAVFALLPAQNATGNWVKVVQRVPVRLTLVHPPSGAVLQAGLSAHVRVDTRSAPDSLRGR